METATNARFVGKNGEEFSDKPVNDGYTHGKKEMLVNGAAGKNKENRAGRGC